MEIDSPIGRRVGSFGFLVALFVVPAAADFVLSDPESEVYYRLAITAGEQIQVEKDSEIAGHLHSNDRIDLKQDTLVTGDISAVGEIDAQGTVTGAIAEGAPPVTLPALLDAADLRALADRVFETDTDFTDAVIDDVVFVDGKVDVFGTLEGVGTIIATRDIRLHQDPSPLAESTRISLIALDDIRLDQGRVFRGVLRAGRDVAFETGVALEGVLVADGKAHVKNDSTVTFLDFDQAPPEIELLMPTDGSFLPDASPQISAELRDDFSGIDPASVELWLDGADRTGEASFDGSILAFTPSVALLDGLHTVEIVVADHSDNEAQKSFAFTIDTVAPLLSIDHPQQAEVVEEESLEISVSFSDAGAGVDPASVQVTIDSTDISASCSIDAVSATCPSPLLDEGDRTVAAQVADLAGNSSSSAVTFEVSLGERRPPTLVLLAPSRAVLYESPTFELSYFDLESGLDLASLAVAVDGQDLLGACDVGESSAVCPTSVAPGPHVFTASLADLEGNTALLELPFELVVDTAPPQVTIEAPADGALLSRRLVAVTGSVSDDGRVASVSVAGLSAVLDGGTYQAVVELPEGPTEIVIEAFDEAGNTNSVSRTVIIDTRPPQVTLDSPRSDQQTHLAEVQVSGTASDPNGLAGVSINGVGVALVGGAFDEVVALAEGINPILIEVADTAGNVQRLQVAVTRFALPEVTIAEPVDFTVLTTPTVDVRGIVDGTAASVTVGGVVASIAGGEFLALDVPLHEGQNLLTAMAVGSTGRLGLDTAIVVLDRTGPQVTVEIPAEGEVLHRSLIAVSGYVSDALSGLVDPPVPVTVAGQTATVLGSRYVADGISLQPGANVVRIEAEDAAGNVTFVDRRVVFEPRSGGRIEVASGDRQRAPIASALPQPLVARVTDAAGQPVPGVPVIFKAEGNNGSFPNGGRRVLAITGAGGEASTSFTLGTLAGAGTQRVSASAVGFGDPAIFTADAAHGPASRLVMDAGHNQVGLIGQALPHPLVAVAVDDGFNRVAGAEVEFSVVAGGGAFGDGEPAKVVTTDSRGRAIVTWTLGPLVGVANNTARASLAGAAGEPASFVASSRVAGDPAQTRIAGVVLDNTDQPVPGATVRIAGSGLETLSEADGTFFLEGVPVGELLLEIDASTTSRPGSWPHLEFEMFSLPGHENRLDRPVYVLPLNPEGLAVSGTEGGVLNLDGVPGFALEVAPGSVTFPDGSKTGTVSVTSVHTDRVPMLPNFGQQPRFVITIQPAGAVFDPPARMSLPNTDGLAPGQVTELYSFDHDLGRFVAIGQGTVTDDGAAIVSNPGVGVRKAGWHCGGDPDPETGATHDCPQCTTCVEETCVADPNQEGDPCDDEEWCTINDRCQGAYCRGDEVTVDEIEGPCVAAVGQEVSFTVQSNAPDRVKWSSGSSGGRGSGESYSGSWDSIGFASVVAGCRQFESKTVLVDIACDSVVPELEKTSTQLFLPDGHPSWGFHTTDYSLTVVGCVQNSEWCYRLKKFKAASNNWVNPTMGFPVDSPESEFITPGNCEWVLEDLDPIHPDPSAGGGKRPRNWVFNPQGVIRGHEEYHEVDFGVGVVGPMFADMIAFISNYKCEECFTRPPYDEFYEELYRLEEAYEQPWAGCAPRQACTLAHERRAYEGAPIEGHPDIKGSNELTLEFMEGIRERARREGWKVECQ